MECRLMMVIASCLLVASASAGPLDGKTKTIETGPMNIAVLTNVAPVFLTCRIPASQVATARVQWWEYGTNSNGRQISDKNVLLPGHPNVLRYSMIMDMPGQYDLEINPVLVADGTFYDCVEANMVPPAPYSAGAELVVIEAYPNCSSTMTSSIVIEGDYYTMECIMRFGGSAGIKPLMTWTGPEPFLKAITNTNASVWSGISFTVNRAMDAQSYTCVTNFTQDGFGGTNEASNIPTWSYAWRSAQLLVHWGPKNMYATPDQTFYDVGTVVTCYADAFPAATYFWQNIGTTQVYYSQSFVIDASMVGMNRMRCHAENYINGVLYYNDHLLDVNVNPVPTTHTPGSSTTVTTPPAEAYCQDLSGRWQATNPKAALCIWVDIVQNGVLTGMLMNDTATYWDDLYGRVQVNTWDQGGFTSISPGKIGVNAYVLECKRCVGVDTLTVSQIQRSEASMSTCGDAGVSISLPDFTFYRVTNAPPCTSAPPP